MLPFPNKIWIDGENLDALDLDEQLEQNIEYIHKRNIKRTFVRNGISDYPITVAEGWRAVIPEVLNVGLTTKGGDVLLTANIGFVIGGANGLIHFDWLVQSATQADFFLGSLTTTPFTLGLFTEQYLAGYFLKKTFRFLWTDVLPDQYLFTLYCKTDVGTSTFNLTNTITEIIAEEYSKVNG